MPLYCCPHCQTQNFYARARVRLASRIPLECWKCGKELKKTGGKEQAKKGRGKSISGR